MICSKIKSRIFQSRIYVVWFPIHCDGQGDYSANDYNVIFSMITDKDLLNGVINISPQYLEISEVWNIKFVSGWGAVSRMSEPVRPDQRSAKWYLSTFAHASVPGNCTQLPAPFSEQLIQHITLIMDTLKRFSFHF